MDFNAQILKKGNHNEFAVLPYKEYLQMKEMLEDYNDLLALRKAKTFDAANQGKSAQDILKEMELS